MALAQGDKVFLLASQSPAVGITGIVTMLIVLTHYRIVHTLLKMHLRALECGGKSREQVHNWILMSS